MCLYIHYTHPEPRIRDYYSGTGKGAKPLYLLPSLHMEATLTLLSMPISAFSQSCFFYYSSSALVQIKIMYKTLKAKHSIGLNIGWCALTVYGNQKPVK